MVSVLPQSKHVNSAGVALELMVRSLPQSQHVNSAGVALEFMVSVLPNHNMLIQQVQHWS